MKQKWRRSGTGKGFLKSQKINKGRSVVMMGLGRPGFNQCEVYLFNFLDEKGEQLKFYKNN